MTSEIKEKEKIDVNEVKKLVISVAIRCQQDFYELLSDWNEYDSTKPNLLKNWIGIVLFGPPKLDENTKLSSSEDILFVYKPEQMIRIDNLYAKIVEHGTQNTEDRKVLCGLIYTVIVLEKSIKDIIDRMDKEEFIVDNLINYVNIVPIFRVLKNTVEKKKDAKERELLSKTVNMEYYYIDDNERVYKSWTGYLTNNVLPPCLMVVPHGGEYQGNEEEQWSDEMSYVWVEVHESPACKNRILNILDKSSTFLSVGCLALSVAGAFTPLGPIAGVAGGIGMGVTSLWTIGRSSQELIDRSAHSQSIDLRNKEGFTCWFSIASNVAVVASSGGSLLLSRAIKNGVSVSKTVQIVHDGVQIGTIAITGVNVGLSAFNIYDTYQTDRTFSTQEIVNLTASLLLLGNSVVNFKLTKTIIETHQTTIIKDYENSLRSNRHRKEFQKMVKNTRSIIDNPTKVNEQIIRGINKINNKDEFFALILKNKKSFASQGIKPAFIDGQCIINGRTLLNPVDFVKGMTKNSISMKSVAVKSVTVPLTSKGGIPNENSFKTVLKNFVSKHTKDLTAFVTLKVNDFIYVITDISSVDNPDVIFKKLLVLALKIIQVMNEEGFFSYLLVKAVDFLWDYIKMNIREVLSELSDETLEFREILIKMLSNLYFMIEEKLEEWVSSFKEYLRINFNKI